MEELGLEGFNYINRNRGRGGDRESDTDWIRSPTSESCSVSRRTGSLGDRPSKNHIKSHRGTIADTMGESFFEIA